MNNPIPTNAAENHPPHWLSGLRPFLWWGLFVLVLYGCRQHQIWSERTHLKYAVILQQKPVGDESMATVDGTPTMSGNQVPIGWRKLVISHPQAEPWTTNLFIWYGAHDLGPINLKRSTGTLEVQISPPAPWLQIQGPEFSQILTNTSGLTVSVPTDLYSLDVRYAHWQQHAQVSVRNGVTTPWRITPQLGTVTATCVQTGASFELLTSDNRQMETGEFPATITDLPAGSYKIISQHHRNRRGDMVVVKLGITNEVRVEFVYGKLILETEPAGATVVMEGGQVLGDTPLSLPELPTGTWKLTLQRNGYEPAAVSLEVLANQTTTFRTNLVSRNYTAAITAAERFLTAKDYNRALQASGDALLAKPNDPVAFKLQREAAGYVSLRRAETLGKRGDYMAGVKELEVTLNALPNNAEAIQLLADFKQRIPEQKERLRVERLNRGKNAFEAVLSRHVDANLFESYEFKTSQPVDAVKTAILEAFSKQPAFRVIQGTSTPPETFIMEAVQEFSTVLATSAGRRICVIVGGQARDDETQIRFKVLEYKTEAVNKFSIGALIGTPVEVNYVAIHPARMGTVPEKLQARVNEGVSNVTAIIQSALGQSPATPAQ